MGVAAEEISNEYPVGMVLDNQISGLSIVASHHLEAKREVVTATGAEKDTQLLFHILNRGL